MKKRIVLLLLIVSLAIGMSSGVGAKEISPDYGISLTYEKFIDGSSTLTISGSTAKCVSTVRGSSGVTKILISQVLQKKNAAGEWVYITNWSKTQNGKNGDASNSKSNLAKGSYRLKTTFTLYYNSSTETVIKYSSIKTV